MTPRRWQRVIWIGVSLLVMALAVTLISAAFRDNLLYYYTPSQILEAPPALGSSLRLGGYVEPGSFRRFDDGLTVSFVVTDFKKSVAVRYTGVLPDLFREKQGVIVRGHMEQGSEPLFVAEEVLAKHDEEYRPPEAGRVPLTN